MILVVIACIILAVVLALVVVARSDWGPEWHDHDLGSYARINGDKLHVRQLSTPVLMYDDGGPWIAEIEFNNGRVAKGGGAWDTAKEAKRAIYAKYKAISQ